jgi:multiple sugar transport system permease protein
MSFIQKCKTMRGQQIIVTIVFLIAPLLLLFTFTYLPFFKMVQFSFYDRDYLRVRSFVGLRNYIDVFTRSDCFQALKLSLYYMVGSVFQISLALLFATVLSFKVRGSKFFRGALYFPCLICGIAVGFIFKFFLNPGFVLDTLLGWVGIAETPNWLENTAINNIVLVACSLWKYMGQNIVLFIGAIASVDPVLYEAAEIDGCNAWQRFKFIIVPSIRTIVVLNLILSISGALSAFEMPYVVTGGTFGTSTYFVVMNKLAHTDMKVGLASAMAVVLLGIIVIVTFIQKFAEKKMDEAENRPKHYV